MVAEKLLTYALGRGVEHDDMPVVRAIVRGAEGTNYRFSSLIMGIVKSPAFQMNMKPAAAAPAYAAGGPLTETESIMFITKKHIPRRTVLRGAGAALALPFLEAMVPARTALAQTAAAPKPRFVGLFVPHGGGARVLDARDGRRAAGNELPLIWKAFEPNLKDDLVILSGLHARSAEPPPGVTGADHWVAAAFMCAEKPKKTAGADVQAGTTIDQMIAQKIGSDSLLPSLQMAVEDPGSNSSNCGEGYSCVYTNTISWASPTSPLPMELNPQVVFERMFGDGTTAEQRAARRKRDQSILDSLTDSLSRLRGDLGASDRERLDDYAGERARDRAAAADRDEGVGRGAREHRGAGRRAADVRRAHQAAVRPAGAGVRGRHHARRHAALRARPDRPPLSRQRGADRRASTACRTTARIRARILDLAKINQYHAAMVAHLAENLKKKQEGDGTILDNSLILFGSNMGNSNQHVHYDVPHILVGESRRQAEDGTPPRLPVEDRCRRAT